MGGRYYITGSQIGMAMALLESGRREDVKDLLNDIELKQFIGKKKDVDHMISELNKGLD